MLNYDVILHMLPYMRFPDILNFKFSCKFFKYVVDDFLDKVHSDFEKRFMYSYFRKYLKLITKSRIITMIYFVNNYYLNLDNIKLGSNESKNGSIVWFSTYEKDKNYCEIEYLQNNNKLIKKKNKKNKNSKS